MKLLYAMVVFFLVASMLIVSVLATGGFTINIKGNIQYDIQNSTFYIKDIRLSDGTTEGETLTNFSPGFINENFDIDLGTVTSNSETIVIEIDVINTTSIAYKVSSSSSITNGTIAVSGTIAGDNISLEEVMTYDGISGTVYINIAKTSAGEINLDNVIIDVEEIVSYSVTINNNDDEIKVWYKTDLNSDSYTTVESGSSVELSVDSYLYLTLDSNPYPYYNQASLQEESSTIEPRRYFFTYNVYANGVNIGSLVYVQDNSKPALGEGSIGECAYYVLADNIENEEVETSLDENNVILICKITKPVVIDIGEST